MADSKIPHNGLVLVNDSSEYFTESTALSPTGFSFTIPAKTIYAYHVFLGYQNHAPADILLTKNNGSSAPYYVLVHGGDSANAFISGYTAEELTVYVWGKYGAGGSSARAYVRGWYKYV